MTSELPNLIRFLSEGLKFRIRQRTKAFSGSETPFDYYLMDLSSFKLRLSDRTPFILIDGHPQGPEAGKPRDIPALIASLKTMISNLYFQRQIPVLMYEGSHPDLRSAVRLNLPSCVFLDEKDIETIVTGTVSDKRLLDSIAQQVPISSLAPYEVGSPVTGSRFFGREYEIRTIFNHPTTNYAIIGVRRIGKTSLMLEMKRRMEENDEQGVYFFDCSDFSSADEYIQTVTAEIDIRRRERMNLEQFPHFLRLKSLKGKRPLTFLLDEIDHLIAFDRSNNFQLLQLLRSSSNQGFCRYIMTGYREVIEESIKEQSYLFNFVTRFELGNLDREDTRRLVMVPMGNLGVSFERENELVAQIFQETGGFPMYVQFYCSILVQIMDREMRRRIGPEDLKQVHNDSEFEREVFRTFEVNTDNLEKAIFYSFVKEHTQFTARDIDVALKKRKVYCPQIKLAEACDHLCVAGFLAKNGQYYSFAIPILVRLLNDHFDLDFLFSKAREDGKL